MDTNLYIKIKLLLVLLISAIVPQIQAQKNQAKSKPNIIFIMVDDLGYGDLGAYGQNKIKTPNIDNLASEGIRFTQAYAGGPVCTPSRSVLMTGLHNGHTPARDNIPHYHTYLEDEDKTIAEVLKEAGYRTGGVGKWSLGDAGTEGRATNQGFDMWLGYLNQDHAHYYYTEYLDYNEGRLELPGNTVLREHYSHNILTSKALQFIRQSKAQSFFLYAAYTLPHFSAKSEDIHGLTVPSTEPYNDKNWPESAKKYAAMVHLIDRDVGRITQLIDKLGLSENTLIIFTSDNGGHSTIWKEFNTNGPLRGYKRYLTEGGIRVPFIARWPGEIPSGEVSREIVAFQDMMPTFAELAGVQSPQNIDGISIREALMGNEIEKPHEYLYWDYGHTRNRYEQAVRMGEWKGIRLGQGNEIQLYNLEEDLGEENNIAEKHPEIVRKIDGIMEAAFEPNERYPIGEEYTGDPIWRKQN
ncbi:arylsulfatase [Halalkalibaculum sp. DA3122]|uniref:arylsulfatase n=1 Tax=Halalkalibaculum sp. DA3122 TaxID=3373607 RepID=UPI003755352B